MHLRRATVPRSTFTVHLTSIPTTRDLAQITTPDNQRDIHSGVHVTPACPVRQRTTPTEIQRQKPPLTGTTTDAGDNLPGLPTISDPHTVLAHEEFVAFFKSQDLHITKSRRDITLTLDQLYPRQQRKADT